MKNKFVLVGCEESGRVTEALRRHGVNAFSCDILPTSGNLPQFHFQGDLFDTIKTWRDYIAGIIAFPPCTYLTVAGNKWANDPVRKCKREYALMFVTLIADFAAQIDVPYAIENPVGYLNTHWRKPEQIINPWQFGDPYAKRTCLWLFGLPNLEPTNVLERPPEGWQNQSFDPSGKNRGFSGSFRDPALRSKTFPGIAEAMADQWAKYFCDLGAQSEGKGI